jgi:hypothetical protein
LDRPPLTLDTGLWKCVHCTCSSLGNLANSQEIISAAGTVLYLYFTSVKHDRSCNRNNVDKVLVVSKKINKKNNLLEIFFHLNYSDAAAASKKIEESLNGQMAPNIFVSMP